MRHVIVYVGLSIASLTGTAQQPVIKADPSCTRSLSQGNSLVNSFGSVSPGCVVSVYSDQDTQRLMATVQQSAGQFAQTNQDSLRQSLEKEINTLQKQIQNLSDANDALTKRLDDLEKKNKVHNASSHAGTRRQLGGRWKATATTSSRLTPQPRTSRSSCCVDDLNPKS
jgi:TolA-binding protein